MISFVQRREFAGVEGVEGSLDAVNDDADDEDADSDVEQNAEFDQDRGGADEQQAREVDSVFQNQISADLRIRAMAPGMWSVPACSGRSGRWRARATAAMVPPAPSSRDGM